MSPASASTTKTLGLRRLEVGDFVMLLYVAAFARQYFWPVANGAAAWALTLVVTAFVWLWHLRTKEDAGPTPRAFWLLVLPTLAFFYALRAALPDMAWDVLDYRLVNAERALRGWPFIAGDFFPSRFPFNPAPDMALGLARHLLGYRLGTVVNLLVLVWAGQVLERLLRPYVSRAWLRAGAVLLLLLTEQLLFEVNNYMVDLLALPLLLEVTRLALKEYDDDGRARRRALVRAGLYLGASLALKLSNLAFAAPLFLLCFYRLALEGRRVEWKPVLLALAAAALPLAPYALYMYWQTGSPVFPLYNNIFHSPYWPAPDPRTERWGPVVDDVRFKNMKAWEVLLWPVLLPFRVEHTGGDLGPHWGRLSLAFVACLACVLWRRADLRLRQLALVVLAGSVLWAAGSGMHRYATYVELAGGLVLVYLVKRLRETTAEGKTLNLARALGVVLVLVLATQTVSSCVYGYRFEWGGRPTFFAGPSGHLEEARNILRDRAPQKFLSPSETKLIDSVDVWAQSGPLTGGYQLTLRPDAPQWCLFMPEFFSTDEARARFARAVEAARGKRVYTLALDEHLPASFENIQRAGLGVGRVTPLSLPFYSRRARFHAASLVEILPHTQAPPRRIKTTSAGGPLPDAAFRAALRWAETPAARARAGSSFDVRVVVRNDSSMTWPALGQTGNHLRLLAGNHWLTPSGRAAVSDDARAQLPYDLAPGEEVETTLNVRAPLAPGEYVLEVDLLQESFAWFASKGSPTLRHEVVVEP